MFHVQNPLPSSKPTALKLPSNFRSPSGLSSFRIVALSRWLGLRNLPLSPARFPFAPRQRQSVLVTIRFRIIVSGSREVALPAKLAPRAFLISFRYAGGHPMPGRALTQPSSGGLTIPRYLLPHCGLERDELSTRSDEPSVAHGSLQARLTGHSPTEAGRRVFHAFSLALSSADFSSQSQSVFSGLVAPSGCPAGQITQPTSD